MGIHITSYLYTLALRETDPWLFASDDEDVTFSGSKRIVDCVLDVDDIEATIMALPVCDHANTTHVSAASDHSNHTSVEFDEVGNLASGKINLHSIVDLDERIWISDSVFRETLGQSFLSSPKLGPTSERSSKLTFVHHA